MFYLKKHSLTRHFGVIRLKVIILAAGEGRRLKPLTNNKPKCMVELFGHTLLDWQLEIFRNYNIKDIIIVTGFKNESIQVENVIYYQNENYDKTNMVETLFCAKQEMSTSIIISYGDIIYEKKIIEQLLATKEECVVVVDKNWRKYWEMRFLNPLQDAESLRIDENGYITSIGQKVNEIEDIQAQYIGLMKLQGKALEDFKNFYENAKSISSSSNKNPLNPNLPFEKSFITDLLQGFINHGGKIKAMQISNGWLELDTLDDYKLYEKMHSENTLEQLISLK